MGAQLVRFRSWSAAAHKKAKVRDYVGIPILQLELLANGACLG